MSDKSKIRRRQRCPKCGSLDVKTTNAIEAFFGHIKEQLRIHLGLSEVRVDNFLHWYLFFNDEKKSKD